MEGRTIQTFIVITKLHFLKYFICIIIKHINTCEQEKKQNVMPSHRPYLDQSSI